jgi:ribosomal protein S18 acetylase RimI-like enzyme
MRTIRRATLEDAATIAAIHVRGWQWGYRSLMPESLLLSLSIPAREASWREQLDPEQLDPALEQRTWLVEEEDGQALAFVTCGKARDDDVPPMTGEVYALYQEDHAGRTGAARLLMDHAVADLHERGFVLAVLWVLAENERARRFYERGGWRADGKTRTSQAMEGIRREVRYAKRLD